MPRRELLTEPQRLAFTEPVTEEREMVRHYTLSVVAEVCRFERQLLGDEGEHGCRRLLVLA